MASVVSSNSESRSMERWSAACQNRDDVVVIDICLFADKGGNDHTLLDPGSERVFADVITF